MVEIRAVDVAIPHIPATRWNTCWISVVRQVTNFLVGPPLTPSEDRVGELGLGLSEGVMRPGTTHPSWEQGLNLFAIKGLIEGLTSCPAEIVNKSLVFDPNGFEMWLHAVVAQLRALGGVLINVQYPSGTCHIMLVRGVVIGKADNRYLLVVNDPARPKTAMFDAWHVYHNELTATMFVDCQNIGRTLEPLSKAQKSGVYPHEMYVGPEVQ